MARCLLLVAVALLALQGASAATLVDSLFDALKNQTATVIDEAKGYIDKLEEDVNTQADDLWDGFKEKVENAVSSVETKVQDFVKKADDAGDAVAECVKAGALQWEDLAQNISNSALACVLNPINEAKAIEQDLYEQILKINSSFVDTQNALAECAKKILTSLSCQLKAAANGIDNAADVTSSVTTDITKANTLITTFQTTLTTCEGSVINAIPTQGAATLSEISICFDDAV